MMRLTIGRMMFVVVLSALAFASLIRPSWLATSAVYTFACFFLLAAPLCAAYHKGPRRYFWLGFAVFG
jgi:hypothetical protein